MFTERLEAMNETFDGVLWVYEARENIEIFVRSFGCFSQRDLCKRSIHTKYRPSHQISSKKYVVNVKTLRKKAYHVKDIDEKVW